MASNTTKQAMRRRSSSRPRLGFFFAIGLFRIRQGFEQARAQAWRFETHPGRGGDGDRFRNCGFNAIDVIERKTNSVRNDRARLLRFLGIFHACITESPSPVFHEKLRLAGWLREVQRARLRPIFGSMAHNNGSGFRPLGPGMSEASAQFRGPGVTAKVMPAMTGAEMTAFVPHRPARPEKSEGGRKFKLVSEYQPAGDQPTAIAELTSGIGPAPNTGERDQVLLGVTGSGKTFTMAKVVEKLQRPALILAPNKTLAAQLYSEMKGFFPENAVEYFVSYYDYYQPEAYIPRTDTYIEKDSSINEEIDRMRHSATRAILERDDVIIVASVSCIYGIGAVETYSGTAVSIARNDKIDPMPRSRIWWRCNTGAMTTI